MEIKSSEEQICCSNWQVISPEIVEIGEDSKTNITSIDKGAADVYVAVGKNDLDVVKWVLDHHAFLPDTRIFLVHVFSPISYIPTPVGRLSSSQLSKEQVQTYINEEHNRRKNLLLKYISLCSNAKVVVETMIVESNAVAKAILDLIPVVNITNLVMGSKRPPPTRLLKRGVGKAEYVRKSAPEYCEVTVVCDGKQVVNGKKQDGAGPAVPLALASLHCKPKSCQQAQRNFFHCFLCFPGKFN